MENVAFIMVEGKLHIVIDPTATNGPTKSGKSTSVAKTGGWGTKIKIGDEEYTVSLNVYKALEGQSVPDGTVQLA